MIVLLKETDGVSVGKEWQGTNGAGRVIVVSEATPDGTIVSFTKTITTAGTAERLVAISTPCKKVWIVSPIGNSGGAIVVGDSAVVAADGTQRGIEILPGNTPLAIEIDDLNKLWGDVKTNGDRICGAYLT